jgi:hypothetical protein
MQFEEWASENLKDRYLSLIELLEEKKVADECTVPFVPYRGSAYGDAKPKILVIGKATYGWGKGEEGQGSTRRDSSLRAPSAPQRDTGAHLHT